MIESDRRHHSAFFPTRDTVRLLVAPALIFIIACVDRGYQTDFWQHLARGREIARAGRVIDADPFTFTVANKPMCDGNWLSQIIYFGLYQLGGLALVQLVNALVLALAMLVLVRIARRLSGSTGIAALAGIVALAGISQTILIRPQSFSILLFVLLFATLLRIREGASRRWLVVPPAVIGLWANVHGGFAIGLMLVGAFAATALIERFASLSGMPQSSPSRHDQTRLLLLCFVASIFMTFLNPFGLHVYTYAIGLSQQGFHRGIEEWLPPSLNLWIGWAFFASIMLLGIAMLLLRRRPRLLHVVLIACFLPLALKAVRMVAWWFLILTPILADMTGAWLTSRRMKPAAASSRPSLSAAACVIVLLVAAFFSIPGFERTSPVFAVRSTHRMEDDLSAVCRALNDAAPSDFSAGRIFCRMEWGNYLCWAAYPQYRVYMEGHVELYDLDLWKEYIRINAADDDWNRRLEARGVQVMVLDNDYQAKLLKSAVTSGDWAAVMRRPSITVLARSGSPLAVSIRSAVGASNDTVDPSGLCLIR